MEKQPLTPDPALMELARKHFSLLTPTNSQHTHFTAALRVTGYNDLTHYTADLVKVCIMALASQDAFSSNLIPEPEVNISGVLELVLHLLPYEETALLDTLHHAYLETNNPNDTSHAT